MVNNCTPITMAPPPGLASDVQKLPVERPSFTSDLGKQTYRFGAFVAKDVERDGTSGGSAGIGGFSASKTSKGFRYTLEAPGSTPRKVECQIDASSKGMAGLSRTTRTMTCEMTAEGAAAWQLAVGAPDKDGAVGKLVAGETTLAEVAVVNESEAGGKLFDPTGYRFFAAAKDLGAIDVNNAGLVYMKNGLSLDTSVQVAAAAVALLVYADTAD